MNVPISERARLIIRSKIQSGRYASEDEVIEDALRLLDRREPSEPAGEILTDDEFQRHLMGLGLMGQVPDIEADSDDPDDQPIVIEGESLSETVIRERR